MKDEVFKTPIDKLFEFDDSVASVFDDMINRSVPYYALSQELLCDVLARQLKSGDTVFDLGCSTGAMLFSLNEKIEGLNLVGIDNSISMIQRAKQKSMAYGTKIDFLFKDILEADFNGANAVILNYTLQFIRPIKRAEFVCKIHSNLSHNGLFLFSEKLIYEDKKFANTMIKIYENYKSSQGYSKIEIATKREALENVLIPYTEAENKELVLKAGFDWVECVFKWANFATFVAYKG